MAFTGTEAEIVNIITVLKGASKSEINKETGLSLDYIGYICRYLMKKGHLFFSNGRYYLAGTPVETLPAKEPRAAKSLAREIADEVTRRLGISYGGMAEERAAEGVKIKTDFNVPIKDESVGLESNINKVGTKLEKEKFDINNLIESLTRIRKGKQINIENAQK